MKKLINSKYGKSFRKSFLEKIHSNLSTGKSSFCCHVMSWHRLFICWKDLKEVKDNMLSGYLRESVKNNIGKQNCTEAWFWGPSDRIEFIKECLNKLENE